MKAVLLDNLPESSRNKVLALDPNYEQAINTGRKIIRSVYEPSSKTYKISSMINDSLNPISLSG